MRAVVGLRAVQLLAACSFWPALAFCWLASDRSRLAARYSHAIAHGQLYRRGRRCCCCCWSSVGRPVVFVAATLCLCWCRCSRNQSRRRHRGKQMPAANTKGRCLISSESILGSVGRINAQMRHEREFSHQYEQAPRRSQQQQQQTKPNRSAPIQFMRLT